MGGFRTRHFKKRFKFPKSQKILNYFFIRIRNTFDKIIKYANCVIIRQILFHYFIRYTSVYWKISNFCKPQRTQVLHPAKKSESNFFFWTKGKFATGRPQTLTQKILPPRNNESHGYLIHIPTHPSTENSDSSRVIVGYCALQHIRRTRKFKTSLLKRIK
jgi:hypothetical protein